MCEASSIPSADNLITGHYCAVRLFKVVPIVLQKSFCTVDRKFFEL